MYYDQLLAIKEEIRYAKMLIWKNPELDAEEKRKRHLDLSKQEAKINARLRYAKSVIRTGVKKEDAKAYKKAFKHEFLTQARAGYSIEDILASIYELIPNPGLNPRNYVKALRHSKYFSYANVEDKKTRLVLSKKAERYLENEANISLKR